MLGATSVVGFASIALAAAIEPPAYELGEMGEVAEDSEMYFAFGTMAGVGLRFHHALQGYRPGFLLRYTGWDVFELWPPALELEIGFSEVDSLGITFGLVKALTWQEVVRHEIDGDLYYSFRIPLGTRGRFGAGAGVGMLATWDEGGATVLRPRVPLQAFFEVWLTRWLGLRLLARAWVGLETVVDSPYLGIGGGGHTGIGLMVKLQ